MFRRPPQTLAARLTAPLEPYDATVNRIGDASNRYLGWLWWPMTPPKPSETYSPSRYAFDVAQNILSIIAVEAVMKRQGALPAGRRLAFDRSWSTVLGIVAYLVMAGAWDRRAARRRRMGHFGRRGTGRHRR